MTGETRRESPFAAARPLEDRHIDALAAERLRPMREFLREAVRHSNPANPEGAGGDGPNCQDLVAGKLREIGLRPEIVHIVGPREGDAAGAQMTYGSRPNVTAVWRGSGGGRSLILNSHADVVGPGSLEDWRHPPFSGHAEGDTVLGRGSCDAKGSLATYLFALEALMRAGFEPAGDIIFASVADEEGGGLGAEACAARFPADGVLVGEPTGLDIMPGTRGACGLMIRVRGREAHSGIAFEGVNAILKARLYVDAILSLQARLDAERRNPLWDDYPVAHVFNVATIRGGKFGGVVPDICEVGVTCGCIGGETVAELREWVEDALAEVTSADPWLRDNPPEAVWTPPSFEPSACPPAHPLVLLLADSVERAVGRVSAVRALTAGSDLRAFLNRGVGGGANFGPGALSRAHASNEHIDVNEMVNGLKVLLRFIPAWTG